MSTSPTTTPLQAHQLRTNGRTDPHSVDPDRIELSWQLSGADGAAQASYELEVRAEEAGGAVTGDPAAVSAPRPWRSGPRNSATPFGVRYDGPRLTPATHHTWRVRLWAEGADQPGPWSPSGGFVTGLRAGDWRSSWIGGGDLDHVGRPLYLRGVVDLAGPVRRARAHVSALGWYRFLVNGVDHTGDALVPRWTPLDHTVEYQSYDITDDLRPGKNALAMVIGDGRFRGSLGFHSKTAIYGDKLAGLVQISIELEDGTVQTLGTDETWLAGHGRITSSDPKTGETADLRVDDSPWWTAGATPPGAVPVTVLTADAGGRTLIAEDTAPVRAMDRIAAERVWRSPSGKTLVDFGQNMAGVVSIALAAASGTRVTMTFSEVMGRDGELDTNWILHDKRHPWYQQESVILTDEATTFQPKFTLHGFRYMEVDGLPDGPAHALTTSDVEAVAFSTDLPSAGTFECSDERLNQLWSNVLWSTRSNFVDTPTDCPTRERSGWTGDVQVFASTALQIVDCQWYLRRYLDNVGIEQLSDGRIPVVIPAEHSDRRRTTSTDGDLRHRATGVIRSAASSLTTRAVDSVWRSFGTSAGWGDVAVLVPWELYRQRGDVHVLADNYDTMSRWVDQCEVRARTKRGLHRVLSRQRVGKQERYILDSGFHWGEWLRPGETFPGVLIDNYLHREVVATAYFARSSQVLADVSDVLGREDDARRYSELAGHVRQAWQAAFVHADGTIGTDRQDDYVRALAFDLLPVARRQAAVDRLVELIEDAGDHLATGFLSTPLLLPVLTDNGRGDVAFRLLLQESAPSWLGQIAQGATTIWETWEGHDKDGDASASHNHYAFGAVASWLTNHLVGIQPTSPGYRTARVQPVVGGGVTRARSSIETPYGVIEAAWHLDGGEVALDVVVPHGVSVEVLQPGRSDGQVFAGPAERTVVWTHVPVGGLPA